MTKFLCYAVVFVGQCYFTMLLLGAVHHSVNATVPALGWWDTVLVMLLISSMLGTTISMSVYQGMNIRDVLRHL